MGRNLLLVLVSGCETLAAEAAHLGKEFKEATVKIARKNAITHNPVHGVERPTEGANEGKTPAISDGEARQLLEAPAADTLKVKHFAARRGIMTLTFHGKRSKIRFLPVHPRAVGLIQEYIEASGHAGDGDGAIFLPVKRPDGKLEKPLTSDSVYRNVVMKYAKEIGISVEGFGPHALRTTAATNALEHNADIAKAQEWLGHADISTTRL